MATSIKNWQPWK